MKQRLNFFVVACVGFFLYSCSKSHGTDSVTPPPPAQNGPLFTAVHDVLQANCALSGCHAGATPQNGINFSIDATIVAQKDRIKIRAVDQAGTPNQMPQPPRAPLSATNQKKITDWITAGGRAAD